MAAQKSLTSSHKPNSDPYLELDKHTPLPVSLGYI